MKNRGKRYLCRKKNKTKTKKNKKQTRKNPWSAKPYPPPTQKKTKRKKTVIVDRQFSFRVSFRILHHGDHPGFAPVQKKYTKHKDKEKKEKISFRLGGPTPPPM